MKAVMFSTHTFERASFDLANKSFGHDLTFVDDQLTPQSIAPAKGYAAVIASANDTLDAATLDTLKTGGAGLIALRSKGFNNVDLARAHALGLRVVRVPSYSPYSVAEHVFALLLALIRRIPASANRSRNENFTIEGLVGFELHGKTFGIVGVGQIGQAVAKIARGFGCDVIAYDPDAADRMPGLAYLTLDEVIQRADIVSLHAPLTAQTHHIIGAARLAQMKHGAILVNTARGALIDTVAMIAALKSGHLGGACLDVYEREESSFDHDLSGAVLNDDVLARLLTLSNVLVTSHMGFLTREALKDIAETTLSSLAAFEKHAPLVNEIRS